MLQRSIVSFVLRNRQPVRPRTPRSLPSESDYESDDSDDVDMSARYPGLSVAATDQGPYRKLLKEGYGPLAYEALLNRKQTAQVRSNNAEM